MGPVRGYPREMDCVVDLLLQLSFSCQTFHPRHAVNLLPLPFVHALEYLATLLICNASRTLSLLFYIPPPLVARHYEPHGQVSVDFLPRWDL